MSRLRSTAFTGGILAASILFVGIGATAAHAEMDLSEAPTQIDTDWTPGTGWSGTLGGASGNRADAFSLNSWGFGYDIWTLNSGYPASAGDASFLQQNYHYSSCAAGTQGEVYCSF